MSDLILPDCFIKPDDISIGVSKLKSLKLK